METTIWGLGFRSQKLVNWNSRMVEYLDGHFSGESWPEKALHGPDNLCVTCPAKGQPFEQFPVKP